MQTIPACTVKGCKATKIHHHGASDPNLVNLTCAANDHGGSCLRWGNEWGPAVAPMRQTRKALLAEVERLTAECNDLHAEIADKADRLARAERVTPVVEVLPYTGAGGDDYTIRINGKHAGMLFNDPRRGHRPPVHLCSDGSRGFFATKADAVAALVAAWNAKAGAL